MAKPRHMVQVSPNRAKLPGEARAPPSMETPPHRVQMRSKAMLPSMAMQHKAPWQRKVLPPRWPPAQA